MPHFTIRRGLDLELAGAPDQVITDDRCVTHVGLRGSDHPDVRPELRVQAGDMVGAGQTLFVDRKRPEIRFSAPIGGKVKTVTLGHRRVLDLLVIEAGETPSCTFDIPQHLDDASVRRLLLEAGMWPALRARPFERIPDPDALPAAITVTAIDTAPLAPDPAVVIARHADAFRTGLTALKHVTSAPVYVCQAPQVDLPTPGGVESAIFAGPHPAGLPGTHIHFLMPAAPEREVWHIGYQDVIAIGRLLETGRIWTERVVALGGAAVRRPRLITTSPGADLDEFLKEETKEIPVKILSGSALSGRPASYLGRYHTQVSVFERREPRPPFDGRFARLRRWLGSDAIIPVARYDSVMPLDILTVPLLRALSIGDAETARRLGCLELAEDDLALLSHVCPQGHDYGAMLRPVLDELREAM